MDFPLIQRPAKQARSKTQAFIAARRRDLFI
jgi:hypothetical protein